MKENDIKERKEKLISSNRRAKHDYFIIRSLEVGIELKGTEVKSLRNGKCSLQEAYAGFKKFLDDELYIFNLHINEYKHGGYSNHDPRRPRKLLVHKREAMKLKSLIAEKGMTLIPLSIYFSGHLVKLEIGVVKAKKKYDKREDTKKKDIDREIRKKFRT